MSKPDFSVFSKIFDLGIEGDTTAIWCSNQLSNLSNVLYTSNVFFAALSNLSNLEFCAPWSFEGTDPTSLSNVGDLPRFVYNASNDKTFYVDCHGVGVPLQGYNSNAPVEPNTTAVISFKTLSELNAITDDPNVGDSYIVTTGDPTKQSDIATWDGEEWSFYSPLDGELATVATAAGTYLAGVYKYDAISDTWKFVSGSTTIDSNAGSTSAPVVVGNFALVSQEDVLTNKTGGPIMLVGDSLMTWADGNTALNGGDNTTAYGLPRTLSWNWASLLTGSNAKSASYAPVFVDAAQTNAYTLALDSKGKVWAMGSQLVGTGLAKTAPNGTIRAIDIVPHYGFAPIPFFQASSNSNVIIRKIYTPNYQATATSANSAALSQTGELYVTGANTYGNLGLGNTTAQPNWVRYAVSNVKDVKVSNANMFVLTNDKKLYMSGYDAYSIGGTNANKTTPLFLASNVSTFEFGNMSGVSLYVVKTDGTLWTAGYNNYGQLGLGNQTAQAGLVQVPGIADAAYVVANKNDGSMVCLVRKDCTISFAGYDNSGEFSFVGHSAATVQKVFVTPTGSFQGTVKKVSVGIKTVAILTTTGAMFNSGQLQWRGLGSTDNSWANRTFTQVPLPESVAGFRMYTDSAYDGVFAITAKGRIYAYGSVTTAKWNSAMSYGYSPVLIPLRHLDYGIAITAPPPDLTQLTAKIAASGAGVATTSFNNNTNTVTFKIPYTGTIGMLNTSAWTITGTGVTVTAIQNPIYVSYAAGQISFTATVSSSDTGLAVGKFETQTYTVSMAANGSATVVGSRVNDKIAASLSANVGSYIGAKIGDWIEIGSTEYAALKSNISMSNAFVAGAPESIMTVTTNTALSGANTLGNFTNVSFAKVTPSNYPYAISFVPSATLASYSTQPKMSDFAYVGYANIGSLINTSTTLGLRKYYVLRGAATATTTDAFVGYYTSSAASRGLTTGGGTYSAGNVTKVATTFTGTPAFQMLTSPTKVWA